MISSKRLYYDKAFRSFSDGFDDSNVIQNLFWTVKNAELMKNFSNEGRA